MSFFETLWERLYGNVGKIIKDLVKLTLAINVVLAVLAVVILEFANLYAFVSNPQLTNIGVALLIPIAAVVEIVALWMASLSTYGLGEIVDTAILNRREENQHTPAFSSYRYAKEEKKEENPVKEEVKNMWLCACGLTNPLSTHHCRGCGGSRSAGTTTAAAAVTKPSAPEVVGDRYRKCECGATVPAGKCPLCGRVNR